jgi:hypothetical protein
MYWYLNIVASVYLPYIVEGGKRTPVERDFISAFDDMTE